MPHVELYTPPAMSTIVQETFVPPRISDPPQLSPRKRWPAAVSLWHNPSLYARVKKILGEQS